MRVILTFIIVSIIVIVAVTIIVARMFVLSKENIIAIVGFYSILSSAIVIYLQLQVNLKYNQRKSAMDFSYDKIGKDLHPKINELKKIVNKEKEELVFPSGTFKDFLNDTSIDALEKKRVKDMVLYIFNFFERMSIGIRKHAYDEDICYDDVGYNLISFYDYTKPILKEIKDSYGDRILSNFHDLAENWKIRFEQEKIEFDKIHRQTRKKGIISNRNI